MPDLCTLLVVPDEFPVDLHVWDEGEEKVTKANARLQDGLLQLRAEQSVQHQQTLTAGLYVCTPDVKQTNKQTNKGNKHKNKQMNEQTKSKKAINTQKTNK